MSHALLVSSRAHRDILQAYEWYELKSPGLGVDFIRRIDSAIEVIQRSPQLFRPRHGEIRMAMTSRFPYAIYFIWDEPTCSISIRRILHFSQHVPSQIGL